MWYSITESLQLSSILYNPHKFVTHMPVMFWPIFPWQWLDNYLMKKDLFKPFSKNWSIVNLQCCVSFRCTAKWFSYIYIHTHICIHFQILFHCTFSDSFPFFSIITRYWVEFPVLYSRSSLFIYLYSNVYMLIPNS